jgi:hypothetical protein
MAGYLCYYVALIPISKTVTLNRWFPHPLKNDSHLRITGAVEGQSAENSKSSEPFAKPGGSFRRSPLYGI